MSNLTIMLGIWAALTVAFAILMIYRAHLTQYETDQLFLSAGMTRGQVEHDEILRRVKFIRPLCLVVGGADGLMTLAIIGVFVVDVMNALR